MNVSVVSKEVILEQSRDLIQKQGWEAVNIRTLAAACDISVGTIYNYFSSKAELVTSTIESIWFDIFHSESQPQSFDGFIGCVEWIQRCIKQGMTQYPSFFQNHSMSFVGKEKDTGKRAMAQSWKHIKQVMLRALETDSRIRPNAFDEQFTKEQFVDIVFELLLIQIQKGSQDSFMIIEIVNRSIY